jgi:hypothetical protein
MSHQWTEAKSRCDAAIAGARSSDADDVFDFGLARNRRLATAYSNRAVLNWLHNQRQEAVADVKRAHALGPKLEFVGRNWTAMNAAPNPTASPTVASVRP